MSEHDVFLADCPARTTLDLVADTWSVVVVFGLGGGLGQSLLGPVSELARWAEEHAEDLAPDDRAPDDRASDDRASDDRASDEPA
ncbi:hypothetical protein MF672_025450 [Actinomadura sp. ATCC 31491]|uniref:Uncharacterized protein n=1 Tax=Actinomadura luzonensis TaxID=2805427 RepID=A0ABT0FY86_9ACTN|nr:hypothetical protein [Actinomadura luzonensis]MCK2217113.1 hypothetical protein [Actinomadura luzonensis]